MGCCGPGLTLGSHLSMAWCYLCCRWTVTPQEPLSAATPSHGPPAPNMVESCKVDPCVQNVASWNKCFSLDSTLGSFTKYSRLQNQCVTVEYHAWHAMCISDVEIPALPYNNGTITTILDVRNCNILCPKSVELLDAQSCQFVIGFLVFNWLQVIFVCWCLPLFLFLGRPSYGHAYHTL